jgi:hypothetical protein
MNTKVLGPIGETVSLVHLPVQLTASNMPMRDYFAAKAMQGMLAYAYLKPLSGQSMYAIDAYKMADAMLAAREQK